MKLAMMVLSVTLSSITPLTTAAGDEDAIPLSAEQVRERWHGRLDGRKFTARVRLSMVLAGMHEERELVVWRADEQSRSERVLIRFEAPESMRKTGILFIEQVSRPNDYFLYQPELRRTRRLPETVANEDVYGIDLEFLGFGVAQSEPTEVLGMTQEVLDGHPAYRIEERAIRENPRFDERTTWLDATTFVPLCTEQRRRGETRMIARTTGVQEIQGVPTPVKMEFENPGDHRTVTLVVTSTDYERPIPEEYFSALALVRASLATASNAEQR